MSQYDVVVIGSGPGGYVAAVQAAHLGLKCAIVEKEKDGRLGGTCLLRGCIPTKALLHCADVFSEINHAKDFGITVGDVKVDFKGVQKHREKAVQKSAAGVAYLMKSNKVDVHHGMGWVKDKNTVVVEGKDGSSSLSTKNIIIATGSVPRHLPFLKVDGKRVVTSDEILELEKIPKSLIVLGAGAVGVEFASVYSRFGTKCTVVEMQDRPLPIEDRDVSKEFQKLYRKRGIDVRVSTKLKSADVQKSKVVCTIESPKGEEKIEAEMVLVAIGRAPVTKDIGLDAVGVKMDQGGFVEVDNLMQTTVPGIYAIGDIVRTPWLAHTASAEGMLAIDHIAGKDPHPLKYELTPGCTYSDPEVGSVGLTEAAAKEKGYEVNVGKFPFSASGKARVMGQTEGFVKIVADKKYDEILGVHIIGPRATDLIAEACVAMSLECTSEELAHVVHAHPTLTEAVMEAAHGVVAKPIHM